MLMTDTKSLTQGPDLNLGLIMAARVYSLEWQAKLVPQCQNSGIQLQMS